MISLHNTNIIRPDVNVSEIVDIDLIDVFGEYSNILKSKFIREDSSINTKAIFEKTVYNSCPGFEEKLESNFGKEYFREVVYCLLKDIQFIPRCPICHNLNYLRDWVKGFQDFCCRNCINRYQKTEQWKDIAINHAAVANSAKSESNKYFDMLGITNYKKDPSNPNFFIINNYCRHSGSLRIGYTQLVNFVKQGRGSLCKECNEEIYNTYYPTKEDVQNFKKEFNEFIKNKNGLTTEGWKFYYPRELKIIDVCCDIIGGIDKNSSIVEKLDFLAQMFYQTRYVVKEKSGLPAVKPQKYDFHTMLDIYNASNGDARTVISYLKQDDYYKILVNETPSISNETPRSQRYYCWLHKLNEVPKCPYCGRPAAWFDMQHGFRTTCCSPECLKKEKQHKKQSQTKVSSPVYNNMHELWDAAKHDPRSIMVYLRQDKYMNLLVSETSTLPDGIDKSQRFYCWLNGITEIPKCPYCGKDRKFCDFNKGYFPTCGDKECSRKSRTDNNKKTAETIDYSERVQKGRQTYFENTGYYHNMQNPEFKKKFFDDYANNHNGEKCGVTSQKAIENRKKTFDEKYGGDVRNALVMGAIKKFGSLSEMATVAQNKRYADYVHKADIVIPADELLDVYLDSYHNNEMSNRSLIMTIKNKQELIDEVIKRTPFMDEFNPDDIVERIYYLAEELTEPVSCKYCNNKAKWKYRGIAGGYYDTCSSPECLSKQLSESHTGQTIIRERRIENFIKWQDSVTFVDDNVILKNIRYYSLLPYLTNDIILEYLDNRFSDSDSYEETIARIEMGIEEKPKCALPGCNKPVKWIGRQRALFTKHCCDAHSVQDPSTYEKKVQTSLNNWGTPCPYDSSIYQQKVYDEYGVYYHANRPDVLEKKENTRRSLKTSGTSKEEQELFRIMREELGYEIKEQYRSSVYPFCCDAYIPKLDLYIEYQGSQYHRKKPYEGTEEDKLVVEELRRRDIQKQEEAGEPYYTQYAAMIKVWTQFDPKKRECARDNNLNFLEIFKYKDAEDVRWQIEDYLKSRNISLDSDVVKVDTGTNVLF